jgi:hypothetical protein
MVRHHCLRKLFNLGKLARSKASRESLNSVWFTGRCLLNESLLVGRQGWPSKLIPARQIESTANKNVDLINGFPSFDECHDRWNLGLAQILLAPTRPVLCIRIISAVWMSELLRLS